MSPLILQPLSPESPESLPILDPDHTPYCLVRSRIPSSYGPFHLYLYRTPADPTRDHLAIVFADPSIITSRSLLSNSRFVSEFDRVTRGLPTTIAAPSLPSFLQGGTLTTTTTTTSSSSSSSISSLSNQDSNNFNVGKEKNTPLVRIHSECFTGDVLTSRRCDCGEQLRLAFHAASIASTATPGIILYLRQEGRNIGLLEKLRAYNLQELGHDTVTANHLLGHPTDARTYDIAVGILRDLGVERCRLMTNNLEKVEQVKAMGVEVVERVPLEVVEGIGRREFEERDRYLRTKVEKMRHVLTKLEPSLAGALTKKVILEDEKERQDEFYRFACYGG